MSSGFKRLFAGWRFFRFHPRVRTGGWIKHWVQDLVGAALAISVGMCILSTRPLALRFDQWSYDILYRFRPDVAADGVVVVSMDAASRATLEQEDVNHWSRELHAELLDRLIARGARAVAFTTVFSDPTSTNLNDRIFAQSLRRARGRVVLAAGSTNGVVRAPNLELAAVAPWGLLAAPDGTDGVIRRHPSPAEYPTLAHRVAQLIGRGPPVTTSPRWMNYYGPTLRLPEVSYERALRGAELPGVIKGKIVIIVPDSNESKQFPTPYTLWTNRRSSRAEIESTAILNLSRKEWLSRMPRAFEVGIVFVGGGFLSFAFMGVRRRALVLLTGGSLVFVIAGSYLLFAKLQLWLPWLVVAGVQIPMAFAWAWICESIDRAQFPESPMDSPIPAGASPASDLTPAALRAMPLISSSAPVAELPSIPDHTLVKSIGRGAYGEVWLVRDVIGRYQAVKILKARSFPQRAPYEREFKGIERFASVSRSHPGLVHVLHIGRNDVGGYFFYIMELADDASGAPPMMPERYVPKTLASELALRGHLPVQESVRIGLALCSALQHLHERNLVHRDIKPSNLIFVEGRVKIADIGLVAQISTGTEEMTRLGTDGYLAPEGPGKPLADLYALGKVMYEISMGRDRWQFPEFPTTIGARPDQKELRQLHEVILTACENDPAHRYQSASAMHEALSNLLVS